MLVLINYFLCFQVFQDYNQMQFDQRFVITNFEIVELYQYVYDLSIDYANYRIVYQHNQQLNQNSI